MLWKSPVTNPNQVSDASSVKRSATECLVAWVANRPCVNRAEWTPSELQQLRLLTLEYPPNKVNWVQVAEKLGVSPASSDVNIVSEVQNLDEPHPHRLHAAGNLSTPSLLDA
jgi:hypothetical protein